MADDVKDNPQNDAMNEGSNAPQSPITTKPTRGRVKQTPTQAAQTDEEIIDGPDPAVMTSHGDIGLVTNAEHALALVKGKTTQFHQIVSNIGNVASVPFKELEALGAELQYLIGVIRSKV